MSHHGKKLIKHIKDTVNSHNLEKIYAELIYIQKSEKLKKSIDIICTLIEIIGGYLVTAEKQNSPENLAVFDTFYNLGFMSEFLKLSNLDNYIINLQLIKTLSFLLINIKNKTTLYFLCSNNLLNKIISKDYSKYDDEFLSYYVNFLKSLSLLLDDTFIQLFYMEECNSFPLVENILNYYNHKDSMIRNVVKNTIMTILKLKNEKIEEYFCKLPSLLYFLKIICHFKDICIQIKDQINNKNNKKVSYLFDDLYDEMIYIDDLLNLKIEKISFIIINYMFYFFIMPVLCQSICNENKKISKELALFLLIFLFINIKNETFKNCLFTILFFDDISSEIEDFLCLKMDLNDFFLDKNKFYRFFVENYSFTFLSTIIRKNNIIFAKNEKAYLQLKKIMEIKKQLEMKYGEDNNNFPLEEIFNKIKNIAGFDNQDLLNMKNYHQYLSKGTGILIGDINKEIMNYKAKEKEDLISEDCFLCNMKKNFYSIIENNNSQIVTIKKNKIKEGILNLLNSNKEEIILLFNILLYVVQNKEINIDNFLLKKTNIINNFDNDKKDVNDNLNNNKIYYMENGKICFNKKVFTFDNSFFSKSKINVNENNSQLLESLSNLLIIETPFLPITYQIIYQNIINMSLDSNYNYTFDISDKFIKNIEIKYKSILNNIYSYFNSDLKDIENSGNLLYNQWVKYKDMNNKNILKIIKGKLISSMDILYKINVETNNNIFEGFENIEYFTNLDKNTGDSEIFSKNKKENISYESNILIFLLIYDLRIIFQNKQKNSKNISTQLLKNNFPFDSPQYDFQIGKNYNIDMINSSKLYNKIIEYKSIDKQTSQEKSYMKSHIFIFRTFLFFGLINKDKDDIIIFKKINIKLIEENKDYKNGEEQSVKLAIKGDNHIYVLKFENFESQKEFKYLINEIIISSNKRDNKIFEIYFEDLITKNIIDINNHI